jgi:hypothetical protein
LYTSPTTKGVSTPNHEGAGKRAAVKHLKRRRVVHSRKNTTPPLLVSIPQINRRELTVRAGVHCQRRLRNQVRGSFRTGYVYLDVPLCIWRTTNEDVGETEHRASRALADEELTTSKSGKERDDRGDDPQQVLEM